MQVIDVSDLRALIRRRLEHATAAGYQHVRHPAAFEEHLVSVACAAQSVGERLASSPDAEWRPDVTAAFLAGAWHDAGKIWHGDDYHEVFSAHELLTDGVEWGLVRGIEAEVQSTLQRAALAILSHFALREQLHEEYVPTTGSRSEAVTRLRDMAHLLDRGVPESDLLPTSLEARILIYCDVAGSATPTPPVAGTVFDRRWRAIEEDVRTMDAALARVLPRVKARILGTCREIDELLFRQAARGG